MAKAVWHGFDTRADMVRALADKTGAALEAAVAARGVASWAVSGGSTPKPLFAALAAAPLPWPHIHVALVDERWVPRSHPRSNEALVWSDLLRGAASGAPFQAMKTAHGDPFTAAPAVNAHYSALPLPFDMVLLGLGPDGHTASLFPAAAGLEAALDPVGVALCAPIRAVQSDVTGRETLRMTLTLAALKTARAVTLMITGPDKKAVLQRALDTDTDLPVARVVRGLDTDVQIYWAP